MRRCTDRQWKAIVQDMLAVLPLSRDYEVSIERKRLTDTMVEGWCECLDHQSAKFLVVVSKDATPSHATEILIHELAHLLDWKPYTPWTTNHGATFWIHYGEIYRAYHQVQ